MATVHRIRKLVWSLGFKNPTKEDSYLKSATPKSELEHLGLFKSNYCLAR
jgi:hypothetical protein